MSDFSKLSYREKNILLQEIKESIFNHKHNQDELNKLDIKNPITFNEYNPFDKDVIELIKKQIK